MATEVFSGSQEDATARKVLIEKYTARGEDNLSAWGERALAIAADWPD